MLNSPSRPAVGRSKGKTKMALALSNQNPTVTVGGGAVFFNGFSETDPAVVEQISRAGDPESAASELLRFGARTLQLVSVDGRAGKVEARLESLTGTVSEVVDSAVRSLTETTEGIFDPEVGRAAVVLTRFRAETEELLGRSFDPDSKTSIASRLEKLLTEAVRDLLADQGQTFAKALDPDVETSPMGRLVKQVGRIATEVGQLAQAVAARDAAVVALERSAVKGQAYEELIVDLVAGVAADFGDLAEPCGRRTGSSGNNKGDVTVELNPDDVTRGVGRYVVEVKDTRLGLRAVLDEATKARENRDAEACVVVFARDSQNPCRVPLHTYERTVIVTVDKDNADPAALRLACAWARLVVRRAAAGIGEGPSLERMRELVGDAQRTLGQATSIRRCHSTASKAVAEAADNLGDMLAGIAAALGRLEVELG